MWQPAFKKKNEIKQEFLRGKGRRGEGSGGEGRRREGSHWTIQYPMALV